MCAGNLLTEYFSSLWVPKLSPEFKKKKSISDLSENLVTYMKVSASWV